MRLIKESAATAVLVLINKEIAAVYELNLVVWESGCHPS